MSLHSTLKHALAITVMLTPLAVFAQYDSIQEATCREVATKGGFPNGWKGSYILLEVNSPTQFCELALFNPKGSKIRYLPTGLFNKEGFEIKSPKRTVQIFTQSQRTPGGDPAVQFMVPVSAKIDGQSFEVTRGNLRVVMAELIAALSEQ